MQISSLPQQIADLSSQNQQLKSKYKKCLQELMHILSINKTMKEHVDICTITDTRTKELQTLVQDLNMKMEMQKIHIKDLQSVKNGLQARVASLQVAIKDAQLQRQRQRNELSQSFKKLKIQEEKRKLLEHQQQIHPSRLKVQQELSLIRSQNQKLNKHVFKLKGVEAETQLLKQEIEQLKEERKCLNLQHIEQQQRWRNQTILLQNEAKRNRSFQTQKIKQLQSKYLILQTQLSNYQNIERFMQQSKQIQQDEMLFNSIRSQIQKINDNFNTYQNQSSSLLARSKEQEERKIKMITDLESQVQRYRLEVQHQKRIAQKLEKKTQEIPILQEKIKVIETQRQELYQKNNVLEAFMITQQHRAGFEVSEKIEQFERKVHLLLQENAKSISGLGGLQQILILKSYLKELSESLWSQKKKQEKLRKRNQQLREKIKHLEHQYTHKMSDYNKKIANYDNLVQKLYGLLQQKVLESTYQGKDKEVSIAINKYEEKMLRMSDEIIKLKRKNQALQQLNRTKPVSTISEEEYEKLNHATVNLQADLQRLRIQNIHLAQENRSLAETLREEGIEAKELIKEKESLISQLAQKLTAYQEQLKLLQPRMNQLTHMNQSYQRQMKNLRQQLQEHNQTNNYLLNKYKDYDSLLQKVTLLENQVKKLKKQHQNAYDQESKHILQHLGQLQSKINLQSQQIQAYKQENTYLYSQLQSSKLQKQALYLQHHNLVSQLTAQVKSLQQLNEQGQQKIAKMNEEFYRLQERNEKLESEIKILQEEVEAKRNVVTKETNTLKQGKQVVTELQDLNNQTTSKSSKEMKELNTIILTLRTQNLAMKNQLQEKQASISELKHQIYTKQLRMQKEKSRQNLLIAREQPDKSNQQHQRLLFAFTLISAQLEAHNSRQPYVQTSVQTFVDQIVEQKEEKIQKLQIPLENITSLDRSNLQQGEKRIQNLLQPGYLELHTTKSIETVNQPISVVDSNWREEYERSKERDPSEYGDYHATSGSFKMIKLLKQSLKSIQVSPQPEDKKESPKKQ